MVTLVFHWRNRIVARLGFDDALRFPLALVVLALHRCALDAQLGLEGNTSIGPGVGKLRRRGCYVVAVGSSFAVLLILLVWLFVVLVW